MEKQILLKEQLLLSLDWEFSPALCQCICRSQCVYTVCLFWHFNKKFADGFFKGRVCVQDSCCLIQICLIRVIFHNRNFMIYRSLQMKQRKPCTMLSCLIPKTSVRLRHLINKWWFISHRSQDSCQRSTVSYRSVCDDVSLRAPDINTDDEKNVSEEFLNNSEL